VNLSTECFPRHACTACHDGACSACHDVGSEVPSVSGSLDSRTSLTTTEKCGKASGAGASAVPSYSGTAFGAYVCLWRNYSINDVLAILRTAGGMNELRLTCATDGVILRL
jgi:hypothetical protein